MRGRTEKRMRGLWVDGFGEGIRCAAEVDELVEFAVSAAIDTVVAQVTRRGDALANDLPLPRADDLAPAPFDPLAALCDRAQAAGLAVHAWLAATPVAGPDAPAARYEPWLCRRADGTARDRHGLAHLDPGHPDARTFVAGCAAAVAARYPVDGINLDRVRYPDADRPGAAEWGYNPVALCRYGEQAGEGAPPPTDDPAWQAWRRGQVTALVDDTVAAVRAVRDDVVVSTTGCCFGGLAGGWRTSRPWAESGQDWPGWLREERVDRVLVMNYRGDADDADLVGHPPGDVDLRAEGAVAAVADASALRARFDDWARLAIAAGGPRAVLGLGWYLHEPAVSVAWLRHGETLTVGGRGAGGWCAYSYRTPSRRVLLGQRAAATERAELGRLLRPGRR